MIILYQYSYYYCVYYLQLLPNFIQRRGGHARCQLCCVNSETKQDKANKNPIHTVVLECEASPNALRGGHPRGGCTTQRAAARLSGTCPSCVWGPYDGDGVGNGPSPTGHSRDRSHPEAAWGTDEQNSDTKTSRLFAARTFFCTHRSIAIQPLLFLRSV